MTSTAPAGDAWTRVNGQRFVALNGAPHLYFNEAISFQLCCDGQSEVD